MEKKRIAIIIRKDLELSLGKWMAQICHAQLRAVDNQDMRLSSLYVSSMTDKDITDDDLPVAIALWAKNEKQLLDMYNKAIDLGIPTGLQKDTGRTEVAPGTITCCVVGPGPENLIKEITNKLQLVREKQK
jgi:PTH2 family peptidyl-tRNA hydrolase